MSEDQGVLPDHVIQALADRAETGSVSSVLGVVPPMALAPMADDDPFQIACDTVSEALDAARENLRAKRQLRDTTEAEIKVLVGQVGQLERMWRVAVAAKSKD